eukprot:jgi/Mesvir1/3252/Mv16391-RA.1
MTRSDMAKASTDNEVLTGRDRVAFPNSRALLEQSIAMFSGSAVLGPLLDGEHSNHNVLHYAKPAMIHVGPYFALETCWWVPVMFGIAGVILGVSHPFLDTVWGGPQSDASASSNETPRNMRRNTTYLSWLYVNACIGLFAMQYSLSGTLDAAVAAGDAPRVCVDLILATTGVAMWFIFDRTKGGLLMAALTAVAGPVLEIILINQLQLYQYTHPDILGIPTWIPGWHDTNHVALHRNATQRHGM